MGFAVRVSGASLTVVEQPYQVDRVWSEQQKAVFDWFRNGSGNLVVRARAGTGKTSVLVEAMNHAPEDRVLLAAFNKRIANELEKRVTRSIGRAEVKTLHAVGYGIISRYWEKCKVDQNRGFSLARQVIGDQSPDPMIRAVQKLAALGKGAIVDFNASDESLVDSLTRLAIAFDAEPDEEWQEDGWTTERIARASLEAMELARHRHGSPATIDFDDMIFLPLANNWAKPRWDLVAVDECQDMTTVQLELAQRVLTPNGRMALIGDDRQAIYGWRGADSDAVDRLKIALDAQELGLTCTYRCSHAITDYAKTIVRDFEAHPDNKEGSIERIYPSELVESAMEGDFILSRKNAPLVPICLKLLRAGKCARIEGKDIGASLKSIASRWKNAKTVAQLQDNINRWRDREVMRLEKLELREAESRISIVTDQAEVLLALCDGLSHASELRFRLDTIFVDSDDTPKPAIVCSSIHKAKGLEARRVFVLKNTLYPKQKQTSSARSREETNLEYVAVTRGIETLVWVI